MAKHGFFRKLTADAGHAAAGRVEEAVARRASKFRQGVRAAVNGGRHNCTCGRHFNSIFLMNSHKCMEKAGQWSSKAAKAAERKMGKAWSDARRMARRVRVAKGLTDDRGNRTAKGRARPEVSARGRGLRAAHRHDKHSDRTDRKAGKYENRAARASARAEAHADRAKAAADAGQAARAARHEAKAAGHQDRAGARQQRAIDTRMAHHQRWPERERAERART